VLGYADLSRTQDLATVQELGDALARPPINQPNGFGPSADPALRELDTFARPFEFNNGWAHGFTFRGGVMARAGDHVWLSASYEHTTKLDYNGTFELNMDDPFFTQDLVSQGLSYPPLVRGDASLSFTLPRVVRAGIRYTFGRTRSNGEPASSVALEGTYTGWSVVKNFDVRIKSPALAQPELGLGSTMQLKLPRGWYDTFGGLVRASHAFTDDFSLWAGAGAESAAVPDRTIDTASPDGVRISAFGGLGLGLTRKARLLLDLTYQHVLERNVKGSDYDLGNGRYRMFLVMGGAYIDYTF
jgi:long-chain fatty acid transport protein